jgi:hypothetical protein
MAVTAETAGMLWPNRSGSPEAVARATKRTQESGCVDGVIVSDQITHLTPPGLWTTENSPMAALVPDLDSFDDAFVTATLAAAVPCDWTPALLTAEDASHAVQRQIEMCAAVKHSNLANVATN